MLTTTTTRRLLEEYATELLWEMDADGLLIDLSPSWRKVTGYESTSLLGTVFYNLLHPDDLAPFQNALDTALITKGTQHLTTYVNQHITKMLGYTSEEMIGKRVEDFMFAEDLAGHLQRMAERRQGTGGNYENRFRHKDGRTIWTIVSATALLDDQGAFQGSFAMFTDITDRKQIEEQLTFALAEKEVLLREVHHRVKNNLAAIIGLMDMQRGIIDDSEGRGILTELSDRIRCMSLVHEKLYRAESLASIDFREYIQALVSHLRTSYGSPQILCEVDAQGMEMPLDLAVPCGMIINELITNALKYAFPQRGPSPGNETCCIRVTAGCDHGAYTLSVADNGVGIPSGFDWTKTKTLGLLLVRMLGQHQLGGSFELDSSEGTRFSLTFTGRKRKI